MHQICVCKTVYAVGAPKCPQCGSTEFTLDHPAPVEPATEPVPAKK